EPNLLRCGRFFLAAWEDIQPLLTKGFTARMTQTDKKHITVLIPCFNEAESIAAVIESFPTARLNKYDFEVEIIVIDNNSTDNTPHIARAHGATVIPEPKKGKGNAMRRGFEVIPESTSYVVMLDGDNTYRPEEMLRLVELLDSGFCNVALGSRLGGRTSKGAMNFVNRAGNWLFSHLVRVLYRVNVTDVLTGYFAWKREALMRLRPHLKSEGFAIEMEMVTKMARLGEEIYCVPITYNPRIGRSHLRPFYDGSRILWMLSKNLFWRPEPSPDPLPAEQLSSSMTIKT
ncbi:MAG: glycosyltransferase family 2 protein, partial [Candidatus Adlerbacteria bacterium]|nr:glycosyltransferase family 2 protein [Candidatus Adlerbacteria bacterium]